MQHQSFSFKAEELHLYFPLLSFVLLIFTVMKNIYSSKSMGISSTSVLHVVENVIRFS